MTADADTAAPYGRNADGTPRKKPGPAKGSPGRGGRARAPERARTRTSTARPQRVDFRPGVLGMLQLVAAPLAMLGMRTGSVPLQADAAAVVAHAPAIAEGVNAVAAQDPRVAALLERVLKAGPYAALIEPCVLLGVQLAVNHGVVPVEVGAGVGALPPDVLLEEVTGFAPPPPAPAPAAPQPRQPVDDQQYDATV